MMDVRRTEPVDDINTDGDTDALPDANAMRDHAGQAVRLLKTLGNESRLLVLCHLAKGESSVSELNAHVDLSQSALSQHLAVLRADGVVTTRRQAQTIYYALADGPPRELIQTLHRIYCSDPSADA